MKVIIITIALVVVLVGVFVCWCLMRAASLEDRWMEEHGFLDGQDSESMGKSEKL